MDKGIFNRRFLGILEHNIGRSEPPPASRHGHEGPWRCVREHGLLFWRELDRGYRISRTF